MRPHLCLTLAGIFLLAGCREERTSQVLAAPETMHASAHGTPMAGPPASAAPAGASADPPVAEPRVPEVRTLRMARPQDMIPPVR